MRGRVPSLVDTLTLGENQSSRGRNASAKANFPNRSICAHGRAPMK